MPFKIADIFITKIKDKKQFTKPERTDQPIQPILGRTLPSLLDEACDRHPNSRAFNQWQTNAWQSESNQELRTAGEELALGLLEEQLRKDDKIALLMHSDRNFLLLDFASSMAGLVNVPIDLTQTLDNIVFILSHSAARVLVVSDIDLLAQVIPYLKATPKLQTVIVADLPDDWQEKRTQLLTCGVNNKNSELVVRNSEFGISSLELSTIASFEPKLNCLCMPMLLCQAAPHLPCPELPQCIQLLSLDEVRAKGQKLWTEERVKKLRSQISPQDLATIVYIPGETGQPKGVMLTHENITANILTTFKSLTNLEPGAGETVLSFLPLTHIFARAFVYGHLNYGHSIYFSTPNRAARDFLTVRPTRVATVPRLLEKIYQKILDRGSKLTGIQKITFAWALQLAQNYELGKPRNLWSNLQLKLADWLVFAQVRKSFGGKLKYFISGGAALKADLANILSAAGMTVLQGYGLTETSSVICCNQDGFNRGGTVGLPIPGVEIAIAPDQEILVKSPYVMQGYYQDPEATKAVIDDRGWLHTGDLGAFTPEGFLTITGNKKNLFKLTTGKYVTPQPLEEQVKRSPLVAQAVVVGMHKKFCSMLIFADLRQLRERIKILAGNLSDNELLQQPEIISLYQTSIDRANEQLPRWSKVQRFKLLDARLTIENGLLNPNLQVNRAKVNQVFAREIEALYEFGIRSSEFGVRSSEFGVRPKGLAPLRSASSFEFKGLVKKLNLAKFKDFLGDWRHQNQNRTDHLDIPFIAREDDFSTPNSFQIPFVERAEDL
jgi:long-chain acyl-CoA synthetase